MYYTFFRYTCCPYRDRMNWPAARLRSIRLAKHRRIVQHRIARDLIQELLWLIDGSASQ